MIRLVSLNIERSKHLDLVIPFLQNEQADVVCLQELFERDIPRIEEAAGPCVAYGHHGRHPADPPEDGSFIEGTGIFSRLPSRDAKVAYYVGSKEHAETRAPQDVPDEHQLVACTVQKDSQDFHIVTTHGFLTEKGAVTDAQRSAMRALMKLLEESHEFVLCGDFNAPRGKEAFDMLAAAYKDNIPPQYETSLDISLHRAGKLRPEELKDKMVDGLFSTPGYAVSDVELRSGVSDHLAITATVERGNAR